MKAFPLEWVPPLSMYYPVRAGDEPALFIYPTRRYRMSPRRSDRTPGNRGAYEAARMKILRTQTVCGICGKPVDFSYKNPHPLAPTVDHIIPVSKGGHPSDISNLQLAHRCCNRQKSDSLIEPKKAEESDKLIPNNVLEQHCDWVRYRPK